MKTKKGKDLKIGDIVKDYGVVLKIELTSDPDGFWNGKPCIQYLSLYDAYYGSTFGELDLDKDFEVLTDRKDIVRILRNLDKELAKYIADTMQLRKDFLELKMKIVLKLNKKMNKEKEN